MSRHAADSRIGRRQFIQRRLLVPVDRILVAFVHVRHAGHHVVGHDVIAVILMHRRAVVHVAAVRQRLHRPAERVVAGVHAGPVVRQAVVVLQRNQIEHEL